MTVGIIGLGLIGCSLAKAYKTSGEATVLGWDMDAAARDYAQISGILDGPLTRAALSGCDLIFLALPPRAVIRFVKEHVRDFSKHSLLIDCADTKRAVCNEIFPLAQEHGFLFFGGHPLVSAPHGGFQNSRADLFRGAELALVPPTFDNPHHIHRARSLLAPAGFAQISVTTADNHDRRIAFTSQLARLVSSAYMQSPTATAHKSLSSEQYHDLSRAALLDPDAWTDAFLENGDYLVSELDAMLACLHEFRDAVARRDAPRLRARLSFGSQRKEDADRT